MALLLNSRLKHDGVISFTRKTSPWWFKKESYNIMLPSKYGVYMILTYQFKKAFRKFRQTLNCKKINAKTRKK